MVVGQQDGLCVQRQSPLHHDARMHFRTVHRTGEQSLHSDELVPGIEEGGFEMLAFLAA